MMSEHTHFLSAFMYNQQASQTNWRCGFLRVPVTP